MSEPRRPGARPRTAAGCCAPSDCRRTWCASCSATAARPGRPGCVRHHRLHRPLREAAVRPARGAGRRPVGPGRPAGRAAPRAVAGDPHLHGAPLGRRAPRALLDFVVHGGRRGHRRPVGGSRERRRRALVQRPGRRLRAGPDSDWHLLAGDESALPAIAAALEAMPADAVGVAFVEVADSSEEQPVESPAERRRRLAAPRDRRVGALLVEHVRAAAFRPGPAAGLRPRRGELRQGAAHAPAGRARVGRDQCPSRATGGWV